MTDYTLWAEGYFQNNLDDTYLEHKFNLNLYTFRLTRTILEVEEPVIVREDGTGVLATFKFTVRTLVQSNNIGTFSILIDKSRLSDKPYEVSSTFPKILEPVMDHIKHIYDNFEWRLILQFMRELVASEGIPLEGFFPDNNYLSRCLVMPSALVDFEVYSEEYDLTKLFKNGVMIRKDLRKKTICEGKEGDKNSQDKGGNEHGDNGENETKTLDTKTTKTLDTKTLNTKTLNTKTLDNMLKDDIMINFMRGQVLLKVFLDATTSEVRSALLNPLRIMVWSRTLSIMDREFVIDGNLDIGGCFEFGDISGMLQDDYPSQILVFQWRKLHWPHRRYARVKMTFIQNFHKTEVQVEVTGIPLGEEDEIERVFREDYFDAMKKAFEW